MDMQLVLEISAIATIISAGISYITFRKSSSLTYVTQERRNLLMAGQKLVSI